MTLIFETEDAATNWALGWLNERGFGVTSPEGSRGLTPRELRELVAPHLSVPGFSNRLAHPACPTFRAERGPSGRIRRVFPNSGLIEFLKLPAKPGREL